LLAPFDAPFAALEPEPFEAAGLALPDALDAPAAVAADVTAPVTAPCVAPEPARFIMGAQRRTFILSSTILPSGQNESPSVPSSPQAANTTQAEAARASGTSGRARSGRDAYERFIQSAGITNRILRSGAAAGVARLSVDR
jgi:hypothetical protein